MLKLSLKIVFIVFALNSFAQSPHGDGFKIDCATCHSSENWKVNLKKMSFDHKTTRFVLTGQHLIVDCKSCHTTLKFQEAKSECAACHTDIHQNTLGRDCAKCHHTKAWIIADTKTMHQTSRFPLLGNHAVADCASCHISASNFKYLPQGIECIDCHKTDYQATTSPNHQQAGYSANCSECHGVKAVSWTASNFEHSFFPLTGGHGISCIECHKDGSYQKISNECVSCHLNDYNSTINPNHKQSGLSTSCAECHTTNPGWNPASYKQHDSKYFPIYSGSHNGEWNNCTDCHANKNYTAFNCTNCHEHSKSKMDGEHDDVNGYSYQSTECFSCHPQGDKSGSFNHSTTNFELKGAHITADCLDCHTKGYSGKSMECNSCHQKNFTEAKTPSHTAAGISVDCKTCHSSSAWQPSSFKHGTTGYELTGGHAAVVQCSSCHKGNTTSAQSDCISCHKVQYDEAKGHVAASFPADCRMCHNSNNWLGASFNHSQTAFPLTGAHTTADCASCHTSGVYTGLSMECKSCHQTNFNSAQVPSHTAAGISFECKTCHTSTGWQPSTFNHTTTGFALSGGHAAVVQCSSCHKGNTASATSDCISCHKVQYDGAKGHVASSFPTDCRMCHNSNNWLGASFNHSQTAFPLTGAHTTADCTSCHTSGVYTGLSMECKSCHQTNYNAAVDPNHKTLALHVTCADCHTTNPGWNPASFAIHNNYYALTGAHSAIAKDCAACHKGTYVNTPNTCNGCHAADYNMAANPNHKTAQFPTECATCHTSNAWVPSTFNHDAQYFPIYSGKHSGKWTLCSECHTSATNFSLFSCIKCHEHSNKTNVDNDHQGENGYTYTATSCYTCHPGGNSN